MIKMNYARLLGRMKECGFTQKTLAEEIALSKSHLCRKLASEYPFTQTDIERICVALSIDGSEIGNYFFTPRVEKPQSL